MPTPPTRRLPRRPDLDQLRRQAKELRKAFVAGDAVAVAEVAAHYRDPDPTDFALHDAQLVVARAYGFPSWPKLKAYVDGVTVGRLVESVRAGDVGAVRAMLEARPELVNLDTAENDEHRAIHHAVIERSPEMVRLLMQHGADARQGIYPHRDATSALTIATERGYDDIVAVIYQEERRRRAHPEIVASTAAAAPPPDAHFDGIGAGDERPEGSRGDDGLLEGSRRVDELFEAIGGGDEDRAIAMLEAEPALVHAPRRRGRTPLHAAAATLNGRLVAWLLERGADVARRDEDGRTPLDLAAGARRYGPDCADRFVPVAAALRQGGAELTPPAAVALGEAEWLRARHAEGAFTNLAHTDIFGPAAGLLTIAVRHDRPEVLTLLLDLGFDPDEPMRVDGLEEVVYSSGEPLWHCAILGRHEMAEILLQRGADPNAQVYASGSPVFQAYGQRDDEMIELLERHGGIADAATVGHYRLTEAARRMLADDDAGRLPDGVPTGEVLSEELLWSAACGGDPEIVRLALERLDWPRDDPRWYRMLEQPLRLWNHMSTFWSNPAFDRGTYLECFRLLLQRCDANVPGRFGMTILHDLAGARRHVTAADQVAFATLLLDAGARLDVRDDLLRSTPLGWACRWGRADLVKLLLERGADPIEADAEPWATPRAWAEKKGHDTVLSVLREAEGAGS